MRDDNRENEKTNKEEIKTTIHSFIHIITDFVSPCVIFFLSPCFPNICFFFFQASDAYLTMPHGTIYPGCGAKNEPNGTNYRECGESVPHGGICPADGAKVRELFFITFFSPSLSKFSICFISLFLVYRIRNSRPLIFSLFGFYLSFQ